MKELITLNSTSVTKITRLNGDVYVTYKGVKGNATSTDKFVKVPLRVYNAFVRTEFAGKSVGRLVQSLLKDADYVVEKKVTI